MTRWNQQNTHHQISQTSSANTASDVRGYRLFSQGSTGEAHRIAHQMFDRGEYARGRQLLGEFLVQHTGKGSDWVHLQFHMAVFELALGDWQSANTRFWQQVLPTAATTFEALTDAPALLWRLQFSAPVGVVLPWQPLHRTALASLSRVNSTFVQIHNLLALAGAGDAKSIEHWMETRSGGEADAAADERLTRDFSTFCHALARRTLTTAGARLRALRSDLTKLDGSHAQLQLFDQLGRWIDRERVREPTCLGYLDAA